MRFGGWLLVGCLVFGWSVGGVWAGILLVGGTKRKGGGGGGGFLGFWGGGEAGLKGVRIWRL